MNETVAPTPFPEVDPELSRKAAAIALFMGGDYNMTASVGPWGSGWYWDFANNHVSMDAKDIATEAEEVVKGVASHEGNHRFASRPEHVQDLWREPGFAFGFNAAEDPRVNESGMRHKPGTREWIKAYIERDLGEGGGLDYQGIKADAEGRLGYVPKHMQWGAEMIRYWYQKELADDKLDDSQKQQFLDEIPDEDVRSTVESTLDGFEQFYHATPDSKDEMEVQRKAKQSATIFKDTMWPDYQKLVEQSFNDQSLVEMLKDMLDANQQGDQQSGQSGSGAIEIPFSSLPQEIQDEIKQKVQERQQQQAQQQSGQGEEGEPDQSDGMSSGEDEGQAQASQGGDQQSGDTSQSQQTGSPQDADSGEGTGQSTQIPWDKLSDEAKEAAAQAFEDLSKDAQEGYKQQAQDELEAAEDTANEQLRGKMNDPRYTETHEEQEERESKQAEADKQQQAAQAIRDQLEQNRQAVLDMLQGNPYQEFLNLPDVKTAVLLLDRHFKRIFAPDEAPNTRYGYSGLKPAMPRAMQYEADRRKSNVFEVKGRPTERSHRFLWQVDASPSMVDKIAEAFKVLVTNVELANKHSLETGVVGLGGGYGRPTKVYKDFETKRLTKQDRELLGEIIPDCTSDYMSGRGTPLYQSTEVCYDMLKKRMAARAAEHNFFITLTDGGPTDASPEELADLVKQLRKDKAIVTLGFGIGPGTEYVNEVYPQLHDRIRREIARALHKPLAEISNSFVDAYEFSVASVIIMENMVGHPELFHD